MLATAMTLLTAANPQNPDQILQELSTDLMSLYCPGRTIAACPSPQARKLEDHILAQAKAGQSREQIEQALVQRFGSEIVGYAPPPMLVYGSIIVAVLALGAIVMVARRWARRSSASTAAGSTGPDAPSRAELDRLEDALDEIDEF